MSGYHKVALLISQNLRSIEEVVQQIQAKGFVVFHCRSGSEGLKVAREKKPDLIVLDISPEESSQASVLERTLTLVELKADPELSKVTLVLTSQEGNQKDLDSTLKNINFLTKPIQINAMIDKIKQLLPDDISSVLVVDDDESARDIMSAAAKKTGWKVIQAVNGRDALDKIAATIPSVILLDLMMPEMDGFTFINELEKNAAWRHIPIIIVSAKELSADERALLQKHTDNILQKGLYTRQSLIDAIAEQVK
jgi:CheY-like chemotaxis protein